jgi:hypothetical protein
MTYEFQSTLFSDAALMCDCIAYAWMTADGNNKPSDIDGMSQHPFHHMTECVGGWNLDNDWMKARGIDTMDLMAAFDRFLHTRPDRIREAMANDAR